MRFCGATSSELRVFGIAVVMPPARDATKDFKTLNILTNVLEALIAQNLCINNPPLVRRLLIRACLWNFEWDRSLNAAWFQEEVVVDPSPIQLFPLSDDA